MYHERKNIKLISPRARWTHFNNNVMVVQVVPHIAFNNHNKTEAETTENKKIYRKKNKQK